MRIIAGKYGGLSINTLKGDVARPTTDRVKEAMFSTITSIVDLCEGSGGLTSGTSVSHESASISHDDASVSPDGTTNNACVLDAFAGSGSLGIEALSRGFNACVFCDVDKRMLSNVKQNCIKVAGSQKGSNEKITFESCSNKKNTHEVVNNKNFFLNNDVFDKHFVNTLASTCQYNGLKFHLVLLDPPYKVSAHDVLQFAKDIKAADLCTDDCLFVYEHSSKNLLEQDQFGTYNLRLIKSRKYGDTIVEYFN